MKQTRCNQAAWATLVLACALPMSVLADNAATLNTGQSISFDTFTVGANGDATFTGSALTFASGVKAYNWTTSAGGLSFYQPLNGGELAALKAFGTNNPIPLSALGAGDVFSVLTKCGNVANALVTASSSSSLSFRYGTFLPGEATPFGGGGCGAGGGGPTISRVTNNSSDIRAGFPNSGISQGALFKVVGTALADDGDASLHDSSAPGGLPTLLNNAKVTVTVGNVTVTVALYYATPTQIDGVMPSTMPTGSGTLTVIHNGTASAAFAIVVVVAAPGITTYQNGTAVAQDFARPNDPYGGLITFLKSGVPGGIITIWGSGFGATGNSDTTYDTSGHQTSVSYTIYIGGVQVTNIAYKGASVYPGVSIFVLTIPQNVPTGCYVPIAAVTGNFVSNIATLPIRAGGGVCSDPQYGITGDQLTNLTGQITVKSGGVNVIQETFPGASGTVTTLSVAGASFFQVTGTSYAGGGAFVSIGACIVTQIGADQTGAGGGGGSATGLDAGTITVTPPGGAPLALTATLGLAGYYSANLPSIVPGSYVFHGSGGTQVGSFTTAVTFPNPLLTWTNQGAAANVTRSQGLSVTWDGGAPGSYVIILGSSIDTAGRVSGSYVCISPADAKQFTVPSYVLLSLPAGTSGSTSVENSTNPTPFSASGLDFAGATGLVLISVSSAYN